MAPVLHAANDVAADEVRVVGLEIERAHDVAGHDGITKPWGIEFDMIEHQRRGIFGASGGDVGVEPSGVTAGWGAGGVAQALLADEGERSGGEVAAPDVCFSGGNFL